MQYFYCSIYQSPIFYGIFNNTNADVKHNLLLNWHTFQNLYHLQNISVQIAKQYDKHCLKNPILYRQEKRIVLHKSIGEGCTCTSGKAVIIY